MQGVLAPGWWPALGAALEASQPLGRAGHCLTRPLAFSAGERRK